MGKSDTWENGLLLLLLENEAFTGVGDAGGLLPSAAPGSLYISVHTADPGEAGTEATNEATYTGYARKDVARTAGAWTTAAGASENTAAITFDPCTAGSNTITFFGIGTASSGAGKLLYSGALTASLAVSAGITPEFAAGNLDLSES